MQERNAAQYFDKISDTIGLLDRLIAHNPKEIRSLFLDTVGKVNFFVYEIDHKVEASRQFDVWTSLRDLVECLKDMSSVGLTIDAPGFVRYFSRQLAMYSTEHQTIHGLPIDPKGRDYVSVFFDDNVDYVDTGYYYSLAHENGLINAATVRHGHNASKALDILDAVEDFDDDVRSNTYPPFVLYLLYKNHQPRADRAVRPGLPLILERGRALIEVYRNALHADSSLLAAESDIFEQALERCDDRLRNTNGN